MKQLALLFLAAILFATTSHAQQVSGHYDLHFDLSKQETQQPVELWIPYPLSDQNQLIENIRISGDYAESAVYSDRQFGATILYARWDRGASSRKLDLAFDATRQEVIRRDFPTQEPAWNPADYAEYLQPTGLGRIDGQVKQLVYEITAGKTTVLGKAKAIYDWVCINMYRDPNTIGCGCGDVNSLLQTRGGKCTDIHSVYVALARAAGVPAREILGIRQGKKAGQDVTGWQHCWAQFFLPGYGWVPVDPADVRKKMLVEDLKLEDAKTTAYREYFWGGIDAYRIKLNTGRDLTMTPPQQEGPLNTFGYPYAEVGGKALNFYDPKTFSYMFTYNPR